MKQLVELQESAKEFKDADAELIFVFREEKDGVQALENIKKKYKTTYTLALDLDKKSSGAYSSKNRTFDNYVIDKEGVIRKVIDGTLRTRAKSKQLLETLKAINSNPKPETPKANDK